MKITSAVVYKPQLQTALEKKTADVFCKNLKKRSGVSLLQSKTSGKISIEFYKEDSCSEEVKALFDGITVPGKEGFRIRVIDNPDGSGRIVVLGKDERGEFYGMARLLRKAIVKKGSIEIPDELDSLSMTPQYPLRGHQLGYRDKNNTYGAWSKKEFEAYIEDMALFGANAIELLPPKTDDRLYSALFPEDPMELMCEVSKSFIPMAWTSGCGIRMSDAIIMILGASTGRWKNAGGSFLQFLIWMQCWFRWGIPVPSGRRMRCV